ISKEKGGYNLLTSQGNYKVEIGDLENINLKVKGFKTFVEKFLIYQQPEKYTRISVKYDNQIVTTLNPHFEENDSLINIGKREMAKVPNVAQQKQSLASAAKPVRNSAPAQPKPKEVVAKKTAEKVAKTTGKPKAKVKIE